MTLPEPQWEAATEAIKAAKSVIIVTHVNPDGDAIGSSLGLANALTAMGKRVTVCDDDRVPEFLAFLPGAESINQALTSGDWDVMISTDASDEDRTGNAGAYGREHSKTVINLDHHVTNTGFGDIHLVVPEAVSATEIVFDWWQYAKIDFTPEIAIPLLCGLVTDTLGFRIDSVKPRTLEIAQHLMAAGAPLYEIMNRALDTRPYRIYQLWKQSFPEIQLEDDVAYTVIRSEFFQQAGVDDTGDGGLVSFLMQIKEANVAAIFKEVPGTNDIRLSFRCRPGFNVANLAFELGGGGHVQAAGATMQGSLESVMEDILPRLKTIAAEGTPQFG